MAQVLYKRGAASANRVYLPSSNLAPDALVAKMLEGNALPFDAATPHVAIADDHPAAKAPLSRISVDWKTLAITVTPPDTAEKSAPVRQKIRAEAMRRKLEGGFLPAVPAGNTKWIPSDSATLATLAVYGLATTLPAGIDIKAMDGAGYGISAARIKSLADAYAAQMAAIDAAEAAALAAEAASPDTFDFVAIRWPAIYVPA